MNPVSKAAAIQADVIYAVKIALIVINLAVAAVFLVAGFLARPGDAATVTGEAGYTYTDPSGSPLWWILAAQGVAQAVVGSLLLIVILGWFENMLRTQAELVRLASTTTTINV